MDAAERELIARVALDGDEKAYGRLVKMYQSPIRAFLLRLTHGDSALADDLAQETFLKAYVKIGTFSGRGRFFSWLGRIAYTSFLQEARKRKPELLAEQAPYLEPATVQADGVARIDIERALQDLTVPERTCITLCYTFGISHTDVSRITEMPVGTVKSHIARGREKLKVRLKHWRKEVVA